MGRVWRAYRAGRTNGAFEGAGRQSPCLFWSVAEVAFVFRYHPETINRLIRDGQLRAICRRVWKSPPGTPGRYPTRCYYIPEEDVLALRQRMLDGTYRPAPRSVRVSEGRRRLVTPEEVLRGAATPAQNTTLSSLSPPTPSPAPPAEGHRSHQPSGTRTPAGLD